MNKNEYSEKLAGLRSEWRKRHDKIRERFLKTLGCPECPEPAPENWVGVCSPFLLGPERGDKPVPPEVAETLRWAQPRYEELVCELSEECARKSKDLLAALLRDEPPHALGSVVELEYAGTRFAARVLGWDAYVKSRGETFPEPEACCRAELLEMLDEPSDPTDSWDWTETAVEVFGRFVLGEFPKAGPDGPKPSVAALEQKLDRLAWKRRCLADRAVSDWAEANCPWEQGDLLWIRFDGKDGGASSVKKAEFRSIFPDWSDDGFSLERPNSRYWTAPDARDNFGIVCAGLLRGGKSVRFSPEDVLAPAKGRFATKPPKSKASRGTWHPARRTEPTGRTVPKRDESRDAAYG